MKLNPLAIKARVFRVQQLPLTERVYHIQLSGTR
ncbi:hypothetical protein SPLC1_S081860 [Arthrospira platensis C1]|nr:hypothetical protein SPLC1_S081860 [Arthrospira platensis C1]